MMESVIHYLSHVNNKDKTFLTTHKALFDVSILSSYPLLEDALYAAFETLYEVSIWHKVIPLDAIDYELYQQCIKTSFQGIPFFINEKRYIGIDDPKMIMHSIHVKKYTFTLVFIKKTVFKKLIEVMEQKLQVQQALVTLKQMQPKKITEMLPLENQAPLINYSHTLLHIGIGLHASDMHIICEEDTCYIKYRVHGQLKTFDVQPKSVHDALLRRYKVRAHLHNGLIASPQDGMFYHHYHQQHITCRVAFIQSFFGEMMILRFLVKDPAYEHISQLGFSSHQLQCVSETLKKREGLILVCGTTGSGKSTTMHAMISSIAKKTDHVVTLEDPIEHIQPAFTQLSIDERQGVTYDVLLKHVLRLDPDILMIGEMRDKVSSEIALRAALTGHLVCSTMHAKSVHQVIQRLKAFGLDFMIDEVIQLIIFQTLKPILCPKCHGDTCVHCHYVGVIGRRASFDVVYYDAITKTFKKKEI